MRGEVKTIYHLRFMDLGCRFAAKVIAVEFEEYLKSKKIDSLAFRQHEPLIWQEWKTLFEKINPNSFTSQKLYLMNPIRRKYKLTVQDETKAPTPVKAKPIIKPKIS